MASLRNHKGSQRGKSGGRRRNYAPTSDRVGFRRFLPVTWAHWLGFVLFGVIFVALCAEIVASAADGRGADPIAATILAAAFGWMVYLFATTRAKDV